MSLKIYVHYLVEKIYRIAFKSFSPSRKSHILDLICMIQNRSIGDALYFVTFIYDCFRQVWAFTWKSRDQVLDTFKFFYGYIQKGTTRNLKCVGADNGDDYKGSFE